MGGTVELQGRDLTTGTSVSDLPEGKGVLGHAHGEPVLLVRRGEEVFAVGATCTHYSGPLAEGLVVGETVHCPWHHACFDLRTGAPSGPAFNPIPCYRVVRDGARVVVGEKLTPPTPAPRTDPARVVIIGAGPAGAMAAETLRRLGHAGSIVLVGEEATPPVDRPNLSKDYLAGNAPEEWMELRGQDFYREQKIEFRVGATARALDLGARTVTLGDGASLPFDALVLATGASPVHLDVPGEGRVRYVRTLADSRAIIADAKNVGRAVVIGSSFIGLEVAASLRARGLEVDVVGREARPLEHVLGPALAAFIRGVHEGKGVRFHLGRSPKAIEAGRVILDDGTALDAPLVVAGVGVRPRTELAEAAGLPVDRGIVVDETLRAAPGVFAVGDVARFPDRRSGERVRIEHWMVAMRQGQEVARAVLGQATPFRAAPFFWSAHFDVTINYVGHAPKWDRITIDGDLAARDAAVHYHRGDRVLAVATVGRDHYSLEMAHRFEAE
jgi:NADPH-dependent 2,4-dienoyl-CoA reductase/sulfur reductase-like enzyme/nitrite reductase/ring-hydroxylating ferredoxin subunit